MRNIILFVLLFVSVAGGGDAEVDKWVKKLGDATKPADYTALRELIALGPRSIPACREILKDRRESNLRRMQAAKVLGGVNATAALDDLLDHIASRHHWWIAACSAEAVGRIGEESALPELKRRLNKVSHKSVRQAVRDAIARLEGAKPSTLGAPSTFEWIDWAETIEEARARAKKQNRIVLAIVTPWDWTHLEAGYEGVEKVHAARKKPAMDLDYLRRIEPGAIKERAILTTLFGHPDLAALIKSRFVAVRLRLSTGHFWFRSKGMWTDPLPRLGTTARRARAPALVFASPEGKLLHQVSRLGVFSPHLTYRTCLAVLQRHARFAAAVEPGPRGVEPWIAAGEFAMARRRLNKMPKREAALAEARMLMLEGKLEAAERSLRAAPASSALRAALQGEIHLLAGRDAQARKVLASAKESKEDVRYRIESCLAIAEQRLGNEARARELWRDIGKRAGSGPWAARARLYLDPRGPFPREWESYRHFDVDPLIPTTEHGGQSAPLEAAVDYLLSQQQPHGPWGEAHNRHGLVAKGGRPLGVVVPRTAMCICALRAVRSGFRGERLRRIEAAIKAGTAFVTAWTENPERKVWHLTYALHLELELLKGKDARASRKRIEILIGALREIEHDGGWTYTRSQRRHTFNTAPILILLREAKRLGVKVDEAMVRRAAAFLERNRIGKRSVFHYGTTMEHMTPLDGPKGDSSSCMRGPLCELALHEGGEKNTRRIAKALGIFFDHVEGVRSTAKVFESWVEYTTLQDSYRYYFGTWYAARAMRYLSPAARGDMAARLTALIVRDQEIDGSFVDSQMVGKTSSTAFAILTLVELRYP